MPNTLVIANCEVVKPRVAAAEHISQVSYCLMPLPQQFSEKKKRHRVLDVYKFVLHVARPLVPLLLRLFDR
jgi:hypothetical protein